MNQTEFRQAEQLTGGTRRGPNDVLDFSVIAESGDWIVVDKPAPLQVHPSKPGGPPTLWHGLCALLACDLVEGGAVSIINRLDRETSGVVLVAKRRDVARRFHQAMARRQVRKEYLAIVSGWPREDGWEVDAPILRRGEVEPSPVYLMQMVHPDGAPSFTEFRVEKRFERGGERFAVVRAAPRTGRMHQIRVHLRHCGHPVVGDKLYGPGEEWYLRQIRDGWTPEAQAVLHLPRHALHSCLLAVNGGEGAAGEWRSPLPTDLRAFPGEGN